MNVDGPPLDNKTDMFVRHMTIEQSLETTPCLQRSMEKSFPFRSNHILGNDSPSFASTEESQEPMNSILLKGLTKISSSHRLFPGSSANMQNSSSQGVSSDFTNKETSNKQMLITDPLMSRISKTFSNDASVLKSDTSNVVGNNESHIIKEELKKMNTSKYFAKALSLLGAWLVKKFNQSEAVRDVSSNVGPVITSFKVSMHFIDYL